MTCEACERARDRQEGAAAILDDVTPQRVVAVRVDIGDTTQTLFFKHHSNNEYQTTRRFENKPPADVQVRSRAAITELLAALTDADAIDVEHGPVVEIWPDETGGSRR
jgi:hypothetical protein